MILPGTSWLFNMKDVFYHPTELKQEQLSFLESNIKKE